MLDESNRQPKIWSSYFLWHFLSAEFRYQSHAVSDCWERMESMIFFFNFIFLQQWLTLYCDVVGRVGSCSLHTSSQDNSLGKSGIVGSFPAGKTRAAV